MSMVMSYNHLLDEHKEKAIQLLDGLGLMIHQTIKSWLLMATCRVGN